MNRLFYRLGLLVSRHAVITLLLWAVAIALGVWGSHHFDSAARNGSAGVSGTPSKMVDLAMRTEFDFPFLDAMVVAVAMPALRVDEPRYLALEAAAAKLLRALPEVKKVAAYSDQPNPQLRSVDGHRASILVALKADDVPGQQRAVPIVRAAMAPLRAALLQLDPASVVAVTGEPAADYDVNTSSSEGGDHAEKRALPLTLAILLVAFGTVVAAGLPFLMGLATTMVSLGLAFVLASLMPVSNLLGNVVTMIGLAVGIDYSLLMVKDFREKLVGVEVSHAIGATVEEAGETILWSGSTVATGMLGLLFSPILETRSVGIGGALVVLVSVLAALTLLPACLALLGRNVERWPIIRWSRAPQAGGGFWTRLARWIVQHHVLTLLVSTTLVVLLALPVLNAHSGFTDEPWLLPKNLESRVGADILAQGRTDKSALTIRILLRTTDDSRVIAPAHAAALDAYSATLSADARIARVTTPWSKTLPQVMTAMNLSHDGHAALLDIVPKDHLSVSQIQDLARAVGRVMPPALFTATVGGSPGHYNDFSDAMWNSFPKVFGFVIVSTLLLLFAAFRSYLLPFKAVIANLLAISAGYGAVIAIFQWGWLNGLIGLEKPFSAIPLEVPMMIFCLSFGLSMDYELFLLFRIRHEYERTADNDASTITGLATVAPVITGAGLIMSVVFGAFVSADLPALKMIGVGLCVAVLVDASIIRAFVVPAFMSVAGRWNWYPGRRATQRDQSQALH